jgi:uncharacterized cofD-like protein
MSINITTIGGGAGTFGVLSGLKRNSDFRLAAIVSVADSGGTTGYLRDTFGILPPGDFRRSLVALAEDTETTRRLFEYQFADESPIGSNKIGNLLITALVDLTGSFEGGLAAASRMFRVRGKVIPVTLEDVHIGVRFEDGTEIVGEKYIDISEKNPFERSHDPSLAITDAFLTGPGRLNPRAREAIMNSDYVIIGPGDLYTSIVPNLLCEGMRDALALSPAKVIYICNAMTKYGETTNFAAEDFVNVIERFVGDRIDYVVVNSGDVPAEVSAHYATAERKIPLRIRDRANFSGKRPTLVERDLVNATDVVRHDPEKLYALIVDIVEGWIK